MLKKLFRSHVGRVGLLLIILNEIRGAMVVAAVIEAWLKARGH